MTANLFTRGIRENRVQVAHQLIQVMLVGSTGERAKVGFD
jgi:hypothetical protein